MTCLNNAVTIRDALDSVILEVESTKVNACLLVIDKQSTDRTIEIAHEYSHVEVVQQEGNGLANARNEAISRITSPLVGFCDADDTWSPGSLGSRLSMIRTSPQAWGVTGKVRFVDRTESTSGLPPRRRSGAEHPGFTPGAMLLRRRTFETVGGFDESLRIGSDSDWIVRASQMLGALTQIDSVVLNKGIRFGSLSTNSEEYREEMLLIARRFVSRSKLLR